MSDLRTAVVIVGMHRSGTSSIAGSASILGAVPPKHLMRPHEETNPLGHFEPQKIVDLNDSILTAIGSRWNDWREIPDEWLKSDFARERRATALDLVAQEYDGAPLIFLKDPRFCRLLPFWGPVLEEAGYRRSFILPYRNPLEVAASLKRRNGFSRGEGLLLWLRHALDSERATRDQPRDFLFWPDFVENPAAALTRSAARMGFTWPRVSDFSLAELEAFVSGDLRHNKSAALGDGQAGAWVVAAFQAFRQLDSQPDSNAPLATLDNIRSELYRAGQLFGPIHVDFEMRQERLESARGEADVRLNETAAELERVKAERDGLEAQVHGAHQAAAEAEARLLVVGRERDELQELVGELSLIKSERDCATTRLTELEAAMARLTSERNDALSALVEFEAECARLGDAARQRLDSLRAIQPLSDGLTTEVSKVLRQPWRPLAQRCLYLLFSVLAVLAPGRIGEFLQRQAKQRTPRRLEALVRDTNSAKERLLVLEVEDDRLSPPRDEVSPSDIERRILVAGDRIPRPDVSAGERATVGILEDLCALGYEVTFIPTDMRTSGGYEEDLRRLGVQVITQPTGHGGVADFVEKFGRQFGVFYLIRVDVAEVVLPVARRIAPGARIIFHSPDLHLPRERCEADNRQDEQSRRRAAEAYHREIAVMSASDHVVVVSPSDVPVLRSLLPNTPISVFPVLYDPGEEPANRVSFLATLNDARALSTPLYQRYCETTEPAAVPAPDGDVDVSIIIPVYNKWELTRACITSVLQTSTGVGIRFEVILADDNSTDETVRAAELFHGLRIVRTPENLGFLRNCNHAARTARGRYFLFLNNDTLVLPGWLEALFRSMEADPAIGIAGSKLLYPDMAIQEAGAILFRDASARNLGRGQKRDHPLFNVAREVDYISGASVLVRADFWKDVGGFDERFKIAYCEDSDLAMSARARGLSVWYEPKSEVIHFEHQSYKDQEGAGPSDLMLHNTALLLEKWNEVLLRDHAEPNHDPWSVPPAARNRTFGGFKTVA